MEILTNPLTRSRVTLYVRMSTERQQYSPESKRVHFTSCLLRCQPLGPIQDVDESAHEHLLERA